MVMGCWKIVLDFFLDDWVEDDGRVLMFLIVFFFLLDNKIKREREIAYPIHSNTTVADEITTNCYIHIKNKTI